MKAPDKIYSVIILDDSIPGNTRGAWSCVEVEGALNTEYIRKDALLEWLIARNREIDGDPKALWRSLEIWELYNKIRSL